MLDSEFVLDSCGGVLVVLSILIDSSAGKS